MSPKISFHEAAEIELKDAADFYDMACQNLGGLSSMKSSEQSERFPNSRMRRRSYEGKSERNRLPNFLSQ